MDWSQCLDVERRLCVLSGADVIVGTRVPPGAIVANAEDGYTAEEISDIFQPMPVETVRRILKYAKAR